jgi:hypothetical protein
MQALFPFERDNGNTKVFPSFLLVESIIVDNLLRLNTLATPSRKALPHFGPTFPGDSAEPSSFC